LADESRNPADNIELSRLRRELSGLVNELKADAKEAHDQQVTDTRTRQRQTRDAERESLARGARTRGAATAVDEPAVARTIKTTDQLSTVEGDIASSRKLGLEAAQATARAEQRLATVYSNRGQQLLSIFGSAGGAGRPPPPPRPPAPPGGPRDPGDGGRRTDIGGRVADTEKATAANNAYNRSLSETIRQGAAYDDSLRRHGALTTEFFEALARGEVTLKELQYQVGATIAKFAGWTAASVAVFAALDAVRQLATGAIDASAGVSQLQRYVTDVDTSKAQQQFVDLAQQFNLPIKDVADAMGQMGQVFHDQDQAFEATKSALYGVKVGQLSVADSTKYLLAIVRGFGLNAGDLGSVFDRINAAQNNFGIGIRDTTAGVAKAAGVWHAAGGSVDELTNLITAGAAKTGRSGEEIGTALARSAEIIKRGSTKNAAALLGYGIDSTKPIDKIYAQAFKLVQTGKVQGAEVTRLAAALSTPQLAGRLSPILQDPAYYQQIKQTLDKQGPGSAARELKQTLSSVRQEIEQIGNSLQAIGAELVQAGAGIPFAIVLDSLNKALTLTTDLLQLFNELPKPLRSAATIALELAGVMKVLGRFGIGGGRGGTPEIRRNAQREVEFFKEQGRFAQGDLQTAQFRRDAAARRMDAELASSGGQKTGDYYLARESHTRADAAAKDAESRLTESKIKEREATAARTALNQRATVATAAVVEADAALAASSEARAVAGVAGVAGAGAVAGEAEAAAAATAATRARQVGQELKTFSGATGRAITAAEAGLGGLGGLASRTKAKMVTASGKLSELGTYMRGFLSDPLGAGILAFLAGDLIAQQFEQQGREYDRLGAGPKTLKDADKLLTLDTGRPWYDVRGSDDPAKAAAKQAEQQLRDQQALAADQGFPAVGLFTSQIRRQTADTLDALKAGKITREEAYAALHLYEAELKTSRSSPRDIAAARGAIQKAAASIGPSRGHSIGSILRGLSTEEFVKRMQDDAAAVEGYGRRSQRLREVAKGYQIALHKARGHYFDPNAFKPKPPEALYDVPSLRAPDEFGPPSAEDLARVTLLQEPSNLFAQAPKLQSLDRLKNVGRRKVGGPTTDHIKGLVAAREAIKKIVADSERRLADELVHANTLVERERAYDANRARIAKLPRSQARSQGLRDNESKRFGDELTTFDARSALLESRARPADRDRVTLGRTRQRLAKLREAFRRGLVDEKEMWQAEVDATKMREQIKQESFQANQELDAARFALSVGGAAGPIAQHNVLLAQQALAYAKQHGTKNQIKAAQQAVAETQLAFMQNAREELGAMIQARQAYRDAGIDPANIVALARSEERTAREDQRRNPADTASGRLQQRARTRADHHATQRARQQDRYDQITFEADIGRITHQQEIAQLQTLLKTIKHNKALRQQVQRQLYSLKHEHDSADFDMNFGNIKLPTSYEIRRATRGRMGPSRQQVRVENHNKIDMHVSSKADVDEVFKAVDDNTGASLRSRYRSAGMV
jgi:TP901 family phage tail tape measure protein